MTAATVQDGFLKCAQTNVWSLTFTNNGLPQFYAMDFARGALIWVLPPSNSAASPVLNLRIFNFTSEFSFDLGPLKVGLQPVYALGAEIMLPKRLLERD